MEQEIYNKLNLKEGKKGRKKKQNIAHIKIM